MLRRFVQWLTPPKRMVGFITGTMLFSMLFLEAPLMLALAANEGMFAFSCRTCLRAVATSADGDVWATSGRFLSNASVLLHWHHGQWQWQTTPIADTGTISSIAATGTDEVWITVEMYISSSDTSSTQLWHERDGQWYQVGSAAPNDFSDLTILAPDDMWAIASNYDTTTEQSHTFFAHFDGHTWFEMPTPKNAGFNDLAFAASDDGWAVGDDGVIARYRGSAWRLVASPTTNNLYSGQMLSSKDGWAIGDGGQMLHYAGAQWHIFTPSVESFATLDNLQMTSDSEGWATTPLEGGITLLWHYHDGVWTEANLPAQDQFTGVAVVGPGEAWAVGTVVTQKDDSGYPLDGTGILAHYREGAWHIVAVPPISEPPGVIIARIGVSLFVLFAMLVLGFFLFGSSAFPPDTAMRSWWTRIGSICTLVGNGAILVCLLSPLGPGGFDTTVVVLSAAVAFGAYIAAVTCAIGLTIRFRKQINPQTPAEMLAERKQKVAALLARGHPKKASED